MCLLVLIPTSPFTILKGRSTLLRVGSLLQTSSVNKVGEHTRWGAANSSPLLHWIYFSDQKGAFLFLSLNAVRTSFTLSLILCQCLSTFHRKQTTASTQTVFSDHLLLSIRWNDLVPAVVCCIVLRLQGRVAYTVISVKLIYRAVLPSTGQTVLQCSFVFNSDNGTSQIPLLDSEKA